MKTSNVNLHTDDWKLVFSFAHYSGENRSLLSGAQARELRLLADGFGDLRSCSHPERDVMLSDWSHVRDSSDAAVARMAAWLRRRFALCGTCGGSGLVYAHPTALVAVNCPDCGGAR